MTRRTYPRPWDRATITSDGHELTRRRGHEGDGYNVPLGIVSILGGGQPNDQTLYRRRPWQPAWTTLYRGRGREVRPWTMRTRMGRLRQKMVVKAEILVARADAEFGFEPALWRPLLTLRGVAIVNYCTAMLSESATV